MSLPKSRCNILDAAFATKFQAWLQEMTVITPSTGWPWWRMVQKSGQMRYQRQRRMFAVWRLSVGILCCL